MARCKLTNMNLRNIRKSREYQCILIDLVSAGVIEQSEAEKLLGYTIPAGLLENPVTPDDDDDESDNKVTLLYYTGDKWQTAEYDLTDDPTGEGIIAFARNEFDDAAIKVKAVAELNPEYVEGETDISYKYILLDPQPEALESGMSVSVGTKPDDTED